ncbi:hypothetical protein ACM66B_005344 [Microbotryomycetes sp. NB124-2]
MSSRTNERSKNDSLHVLSLSLPTDDKAIKWRATWNVANKFLEVCKTSNLFNDTDTGRPTGSLTMAMRHADDEYNTLVEHFNDMKAAGEALGFPRKGALLLKEQDRERFLAEFGRCATPPEDKIRLETLATFIFEPGKPLPDHAKPRFATQQWKEVWATASRFIKALIEEGGFFELAASDVLNEAESYVNVSYLHVTQLLSISSRKRGSSINEDTHESFLKELGSDTDGKLASLISDPGVHLHLQDFDLHFRIWLEQRQGRHNDPYHREILKALEHAAGSTVWEQIKTTLAGVTWLKKVRDFALALKNQANLG